MSRRSDRESRGKTDTRYYPMIDDRTGKRISSKDAVEDWGGVITHRKNVLGKPQTLVQPILPKDELKQDGTVRPEKRFKYSSPSNYYFIEDIVYNDVSYKTANGLNAADLNPEITILQQQDAVYWNTVDAVWSTTLMQWVNRTYNDKMQFAPTTYIATFGDNIEPTWIQIQPD